MSTINTSFADSSPWRWDWESLCGAGGLNVWSPDSRDLGLCFQQLCLQVPVLSILACTSAYYFGKNGRPVIRGAVQILAINFRCFMVLIMASLPLCQVSVDLYKSENRILKISYFLCAVQGLAWISHFFFCLSLRRFFGRSPRGPVLVRVIWTSIFVLTVISLRSHYLRYAHSDKADFSVYLSYTFSVINFLLQIMYGLSLVPGKGDTVVLIFEDRRRVPEPDENTSLLRHSYVSLVNEDGDSSYLGVAMENENWFSKLLFSWVHPLMEKGDNEMLKDSDDLFDLPANMHVGYISEEMEKHVSSGNEPQLPPTDDCPPDHTIPEVTFSKGSNLTLLKALHKCFWKEFYGIGILRFTSDCAGFAGPMLLNRLVSFIEDKNEPIHYGYLYAAGLAFSTLLGALCDSHFQFRMAVIELKMRTALVTTVYRKVLAVKGSVLSSYFSVGEIVNFMSTDADRIVNTCPSFHAVWSIPFQLAVSLYLLYTQVGLAFLAGVVFSVALIPVNKLIANKIGQLSTKLMAEKDARVRVITEVLRGIKAVKLYVWEQHFIRSITNLRNKELKYLKGRKYLDALCVYFWATTPVLISIMTFGTYVLMGNKLTAATVFTGFALLNMLINPLNAFPWILNGLTEAWVSMKRIQKLLNLHEVKFENYYNEKLMEENKYCDIVLKNNSFNWGKPLTPDEISQLHSKVEKKSLKGKGRGKGKLSESLDDDSDAGQRVFELNDLNIKIKKGEFIGVMGTVGCGKSSLLSAILGELHMTEGDIAISQVEEGLGFVSQQPWLQRGTIRDNILFGKTYEEQRYKSVLFACGLADDIYSFSAGDLTGVGEGGTTLSGGQKARIALARAVYQDKSVYLLDDVLSAVDVNVAKHIFQQCIMKLLKDKTRILCTHLIDYLVYADRIILMENGAVKLQGKSMDVLKTFDSNLPLDLELSDDHSQPTSTLENSLMSTIQLKQEDSDGVLLNETSQRGSIKFAVLSSYLRAVGWLLVLAIILSIVLMQISRNVTELWLSYWVTSTHTPSNGTNGSRNLLMYQVYLTEEPNFATVDFYLKVYVLLAVVNSVITFFRAFLFAYGGIVAARRIHKLLLRSVMKAQSTFFDVSPVGRILNRFSSDMYTIDDSLPFIMNILLASFFGLMGILLITVYGLPWICLILFPLVPVYHWLQYSYRRTSRELKRISSATMSPLYSHFNETLQGLSTIRAMRASRRFKKGNEEHVEENIKAQFSSEAAARWLGLRLQFIGVALVTGVSFIAVIQHYYDVADPGLIGLAVSYALSVTGSLGGVINAFTETEREMIAVERVNQYVTQVPSETTYHSCVPPFGWPNQGVVHFENVVLKYRENLQPSLNGVSFETRPCEKIGVVGRTGAGKSSLIAGLFRLVELHSGSVYIDTVRIKDVSLSSLRSRLFCIPQEPFLFGGTLRDNLDPLGEFRDNEIWSALTKVNLGDTINVLGGLESEVGSGGLNFSMGQKQLVCLARAVLHNAKILCIDEATANVDHETDRLIQLTLRSAFRQSTVLTIAHRVETILDSDRVLVMGDGRILEFDTPDNLLADTNSHFYQMVNND